MARWIFVRGDMIGLRYGMDASQGDRKFYQQLWLRHLRVDI